MLTRSFVVGLALAGLVVMPRAAVAQGFHPRWEIPGLDISRDGAWRVKARRVAAERARLLGWGDFGALNAPMAGGPSPTGPVVTGVIAVPMVLFYYLDTPLGDVRDTSQYNAVLFGTTPPSGRPYTLRTYYDQLSDGRFTMTGTSIGWARLDSNEVTYTGNPATSSCSGNPAGNMCNGLFSSDARQRMQRGLREALFKVDTGTTGVDFRLFDNDGPDNSPNSGDDDGYVDMLGFAHATEDGACASNTNNHIWAHRWVLGGGDGLGDYVTNDPSAEGGNIRIRDYFIQSGLGGGTPPNDACDETQIMAIGTAAHEFGHALGLPDLYDTQGPTEGLGRWGLMGSGNYSSAHSPARMEAWSLNELGWVTVVPLDTIAAPPGTPTTFTFGAAPVGDTTFLIRPTGSNPRGEYFLLENRQAAQADTALVRNACQVWYQQQNPPPCSGGLVIWHVDSTKVVTGTPFNQVNVGSIHGVKVEEADGARDLWCPSGPGATICNRGDAGDPYPGQAGNTAFTYATNPGGIKNSDSLHVRFDIDQITQLGGGAMSFRLAFDTSHVLAIQTTDPRPSGVMGADYVDTLRASGGTSTYAWSVVAGGLPSGVTLASSGQLAGVPGASGTFVYTARVSSAAQVQTRSYTISLTTPTLTLANVLARLFDPTAMTLTADEIRYLDLLGNNNGQLDVGDFKAWLDAGGGS